MRFAAFHPLLDRAYCAVGKWTIQARVYAYDKWHHVDTWQRVDLATLKIDSPNRMYGVAYEPSSAVRFHRAMRSLHIEHENFTFLDLGAGKGKGMLLASQYPFKRIVGVELSPELTAIASQNCRAYRSTRQKCRTFDSICADAAVYPIPADPLVIYMFNPFREPVMSAVMSNIGRSLDRCRRKLYVVYVGPPRVELTALATFLKPVHVGRGCGTFESC